MITAIKSLILCLLSACLITGLTYPKDMVAQTPHSTTTESGQPESRTEGGYVKGITTRRAISLIGGAIGLVSLIIGWRAKRQARKGRGRSALVLGVTGIMLGLMHLFSVAGTTFGSGSGKAGAIVALALSLGGAVLGGIVLRTAPR